MRDCRVSLQPGIRASIATLPVVFLLSSLVTGFGIGLAGFLFLGIALWYWHASRQVLVQDWPALRPVALAFAAYAAYALFLHLTRATGWNTVDAPVRMLLALAILPVLRVALLDARPWWHGACAGALAAAGLAAWERWGAGFERAGGFLNPIVFGNLALVLVLVALAALLDPRMRRHWWWPAIAALAGAAASLLSGSRGGWLALPPAFLLLWTQRRHMPRALPGGLALAIVALVVLAYAVPATGVRARVEVGLSDLALYLDGNPIPTSLSVRLELWKAAGMLASEHPLTGIDTASYKAQMRAWIAEGRLSPAVFAPPEPPHLHNDALQALVTRGLPGLACWLAIILVPLCWFGRRLRHAVNGEQAAPALAGLLVVVSYAMSGLSEVMFWSMKASLLYAMLVFAFMACCLQADSLARRQASPAFAYRPS